MKFWTTHAYWIHTLVDQEKRELTLEVRSLQVGYESKLVLDRVNLDVGAAEFVAVIGHNGAGKTTLLRACFGLLPIWSGAVLYSGLAGADVKPRVLLSNGVVYVSQGHRVFQHLTVGENLRISGNLLGRDQFQAGLGRVLQLFPDVKQHWRRLGGTLSGGERAMLSIASALIHRPRLLLLDEPSLGLSRSVVTRTIERLLDMKATEGLSVLLVEQKVRLALELSSRCYIVRSGRIAYEGPSEALLANRELLQAHYL